MFARGTDWSIHLTGISPTVFVGYADMEASDVKLLKEVDIEGQRVLIFDKTPFYAESGGQTGDK